jgi:ribosomal 50S subunit-recycling heat shock protein
MRIDKFLNAVNITKRRSIALDMLKNGVVFLNNIQSKASKEVKIGDTIEIKYLDNNSKKYKVLEVPTLKTTPKSQQSQYITAIN